MPGKLKWDKERENYDKLKAVAISNQSYELARYYIALGTNDPEPELIEFEKDYYN